METPTLLAAARSSLALAAVCVAFAVSAQKPELAAGRRAWEAAALGAYEYGYHKFCECHRDDPPETIVTVRGDKVVNVRHRPVGFDREVPAREGSLDYYWTIDGLFELIDRALGRGATVRASYDDKLGFPTSVFIDYDANLIGDELDVRVTTVTALSP